MNTKITINRAVLAHALDALDADIAIPPGSLFHESFRAALAEQPAEQEPVGEVAEVAQGYDEGWTAIIETGLRKLQKGDKVYTAPQPAVPPGYKLVPVEPTDEMLKAADDGDDAYTLRNFGAGVQRVMQGPYDHYAAMLAAAPEAPQPAKREPLTDEEIMERARGECQDMRWPSSAIYIARAIERAHGIGEQV